MNHRPLLFALLLLPWSAGATDPLQPLRDGVPEVAVIKLRAQLQKADAEAAPGLKILLAEALLAAGRVEEAAQTLQDPALHAPVLRARVALAQEEWAAALAALEGADAPDALLLRAEALRHLGRGAEALAALEATGRTDTATRLALAELALETGELDRCEATLASFTLPLPGGVEGQRHLYLKARLYLARNQPAFAYERFERLQTEALPPELLLGSILGMADALDQLGGPTAADDVLEQFLWKHPEMPQLGRVFEKLDAAYAADPGASDNELSKWAESKPALRAGYAAYYQARMSARAGRPERALRILTGFEEKHPRHPMLARALLLRGEQQASQGQFAPAQQTFEAAMRASSSDLERAEVEMASATALFHAGEYVLAATLFRAVGERAPSLWQRARFNSALAWLHQGANAKFLEDYEELSLRHPESPYREELALEEGLLQARQGAPQAESTLRRFVRQFPQNPRLGDARLAIAEIRLARGDAAGAGHYLPVSNATAAAEESSTEAADYLAIFVADAATPRDEARVAELCRLFLERHPGSPKRAEVRLKRGQLAFHQADFVGAQGELERLATEDPESPLVAPALFLAGQASMKSMGEGAVDHALELFERVARMESPLKGYARLQQALAQTQLGKQREALLIYEAVLDGGPLPEVRLAALAGKAENLVELGAKGQEAPLIEQAMALYEQLAADPAATPASRGQALAGRGRCLELLKRPDEALAAYYDVLQAGVPEPEAYFWFYKAGFDAGRLCENRAEWKSAIGIYQKIAAQEGPRAEEARALAERLRLEHFIWE